MGKTEPSGKVTEKNFQRLMSRFSPPGTRALSQIPASLSARGGNVIYLKDKFEILCPCIVLGTSLCW